MLLPEGNSSRLAMARGLLRHVSGPVVKGTFIPMLRSSPSIRSVRCELRMSEPTPAVLSGLMRLSRQHGLDLRQVTLRVHTDLFVGAPRRDADAVRSFALLATGLLACVDEVTAGIVAEKLAPLDDTPEEVLITLVRRGGRARRAVLERAPVLSRAIMAAAGNGGDLGPMLAARPDLSPRAVAELVSRDGPAIDEALAVNPGISLGGAAAAELVRRGRERPELARALLRRDDLGPLDRAALFLHADPEQRRIVLEGIAALAALRRPALSLVAPDRWGCERLIELAAARQQGLFAARLALMLALPEPFAWDFREGAHQDLLALTLLALAVPEEDAIRIFLTLTDEIALSVATVFRLVGLLRATARPTAAHLLEAIWGAAPVRAAGQHVPALEPGSEIARPEPVRRVGSGREAAAARRGQLEA